MMIHVANKQLQVALAGGCALASAVFSGCAEPGTTGDDRPQDVGTLEGEQPSQSQRAQDIPLKTAKLLVEHNATAGDTGFQGFADGEPWKSFEIEGPNGNVVFTVNPRGKLRNLGLTELFFETNEPPNSEVPIPQVLGHLPAGTYEFEAIGIDGVVQEGEVELTHKIPAGPQITAPIAGASVDPTKDLAVRWNPVTTSVYGGPITITYYQLIVSRLDEATQPGFGHSKYDVIVPASVTSIRVPREFLAQHAEYEFEVLALERDGNQTLATSAFTTP